MAGEGYSASSDESSHSSQSSGEELCPHRYAPHKMCSICGKTPYKFRGMIDDIPRGDGAELWEFFDAGYFELMAGGIAGGRRRIDEVRVDSRSACMAAEKSQKHVRKLQKDLAEMGLIKQLDPTFTGESEQSRLMAPFHKSEIMFGRPLGTGGFSSVFEVEAFLPDANIPGTFHPLEDAARDFLTSHARRKPQDKNESASHSQEEADFFKRQKHRYIPSTRYAVKHLKYSLVEDPDKFQKAAVDLALEAQLLLVLDHPHILSLRGWARNGTDAFRGGSPSDYFLIIDRLPEILDERMYVWRHSLQKYRARAKIPWLNKKFSLKLKSLAIERFKVAHDVASAVEHMHARRIINRDLKTSNIGFNFHGEVKLFDLGLSRLIPKEKYKLQDGYIMSRVGTKATMAPEVRRKEPYDLSADAYSFGIVLWELLTVSSSSDYFKQLKKETRRRFENGDEDPDEEELLPLPICECWPFVIGELIQNCLMYDPRLRPSLKSARRILCNQMEVFGISMVSKRHRRRSTFRVDVPKTEVEDFSRTSVGSSLNETSLSDVRAIPSLHRSISLSSPATRSVCEEDSEELIVTDAASLSVAVPGRMMDTESSESQVFPGG